MILSNLRKMFFARTAIDSTIPIPENGAPASQYDPATYQNNYNGWKYSINNQQGYGCDFPLNNVGYWYSNYDRTYSYYSYRYKVNGDNGMPGFFVGIGTGSTPETTNDYCLANMDSALEHRYGHVKRDPANGVIIQVESVYENLSGSDVTITEMGLYAGCRINTYNANWTCNNFLIARKVLSTPIVIHHNEVYKFIYKIDI